MGAEIFDVGAEIGPRSKARALGDARATRGGGGGAVAAQREADVAGRAREVPYAKIQFLRICV